MGTAEAGPKTGGEKLRKKIAMGLALVMALATLGAGAALANDQIIQCRANPCYGSGNYDLIYERVGNGKNDTIILRGGNDKVLTSAYTNNVDVVKGGTGFDKINVADGDTMDTAGAGDGGRDWCIVDSRAELTPNCERVTIQ